MSQLFGFSFLRPTHPSADSTVVRPRRRRHKVTSDAQLLEAWNTPSPMMPVAEDGTDTSLDSVDLPDTWDAPPDDLGWPEVDASTTGDVTEKVNEADDPTQTDHVVEMVADVAEDTTEDTTKDTTKDTPEDGSADDADTDNTNDGADLTDGRTIADPASEVKELAYVTSADEAPTITAENEFDATRADDTDSTATDAETTNPETTNPETTQPGDVAPEDPTTGEAKDLGETSALTTAAADPERSAKDLSESDADEDRIETAVLSEDNADDDALDDDALDGGDVIGVIADAVPQFKSGIFTVGESGEVGIDWLWDGGKYRGEAGIFSLSGLEEFEAGSEDFIREVTTRVLSGSESGHVVLSDHTDAAKFSGRLGYEGNFNSGDYRGVQTFAMQAGDTFGIAIVPDGKFVTLLNHPGAEGKLRPLFSMVTFNPNEQFQMGQIVDLTGDGNTFAFEDIRLDGASDRDYNDIVIQVRGATSQVDAHIDDFINPNRNWRDSDFGHQLESYTRPYLLPPDVSAELMPVWEPISPEEANHLSEGEIDSSGWGDLDERDFGGTFDPGIQPGFEDDFGSDGTPETAIDGFAPTDPAPEEFWSEDREPSTDDLPMDGIWFSPITLDPAPLADQPLIGIIDTGFAANNPDLNYTNITSGTDFVSGDNHSFLTNDEADDHGTHILGIVSAQTGNDTGIDGINPDAPVWVSRAVGSGRWADALIEFVDAAQASDQPHAVVNLSLDLTEIDADGEEFTRYELTLQERAAIEYARQHGVLIVAAAGNDGGMMSALGQASQEFDNIITVGAAEQFDPGASVWQGSDRADYSSYGNGLDIMAAGGTATNPELSLMGDDVGTMAGTSVATAKVTGAASQVWAANPDLSYHQVIDILKQTATDLGETGFDLETGAGFVNLTAAVSLAKLTEPQSYNSPPILNAEDWSGAGFMTPSERAASYAIVNESFSGWVMPEIGVALRNSQRHEDRSGLAEPYRKTLSFDAWTYGERVTDYQLSTPDELWYRLAGTGYWVPSAYIYGYPGSRPPVLAPTNPQPDPPSNPVPNIPINSGSANYRNGATNPFAYAYQGQCTWFAYGRMLETGLLPGAAKAKGMFLGHAYKWEQNARDLGLPVTTVPTAGARGLVVWPPGTQGGHPQYGHVAFLEEVYPDGRIRISESNWAGKGISERILTPTQYRGLRFVKLENVVATPSPSLPSPGQPGASRQYIVQRGDTLWSIAQRFLGNGNRWQEIMKSPTGGTFTAAEARQLQVGQSVYLPVTQQQGSGRPVAPGTDFKINQILADIPASLRQYAKISIPLILKEAAAAGITDLGQLAYILATSEHESKAGLWMEELASGAAYENRRDLGNTQPGDGVRFKGRGYVQITGRANYTKWAQKLGIDLVGNPALAADPAIAAKIIAQGMRDGSFTGVGLSRYISGANRDFINARRIVNGTDRAATIAAIAERYYKSLVAAQSTTTTPTPTPQPAPALNKPAYVNSSIGLNFRSGPSTGDHIIGRLTNRTPLTLLKKVSGGAYDGRNDWYQVKVGNTIGYVAAAYVHEGNPPTQPKPGYVNAAGGLNFRTGPSTANSRITTLTNGTALTILEQVTGAAYGSRNDWYKVQLGNTIGYVAATYVIEGTKPNPGNPGHGVWQHPLSGYRVSSDYGWRQDPSSGQRKFHYGVDFGTGGTTPPIKAAQGGVVVHAGWDPTPGIIKGASGPKGGYGNLVIIEHPGGVRTYYAHLSTISVSKGQLITAGQTLGHVGSTGYSTGNHLHFEVRVSPYRWQANNRDPGDYIKL